MYVYHGVYIYDGTLYIPVALSAGRTLLSMGSTPTESERRTQEEVSHIYVFIEWYIYIPITLFDSGRALSAGRTLLSLGGTTSESERRIQEELCCCTHIFMYLHNGIYVFI